MTTLPGEPPRAPVTPYRPRATMREVAALAGVSLKTVSRVVNRESGVSDELAARVDQAAAQLDYRPNLTASNLRRAGHRTGTIGLLVEDVANEFFASIHRGVEDVAREHGAAVVAASIDRNPEREHDLVGAFADRRVDGLIIAPTSLDQGYLASELRSGWPVVVVDRQAQGVELDTVLTDNRAASANAVAHLAAHGHQRIAFIGGLEYLTTEQLRYAGYADALQAAHVQMDSDLVIHGVADADQAAQVLDVLLDLPRPPTAIFSGQNLITMGCVRALRARQLQHAVALVGFDDFAMADLLEPAITVVAQDARAIGRQAAELLFERIDAADAPVETYVVPSRLIARGSGEIRP